MLNKKLTKQLSCPAFNLCFLFTVWQVAHQFLKLLPDMLISASAHLRLQVIPDILCFMVFIFNDISFPGS